MGNLLVEFDPLDGAAYPDGVIEEKVENMIRISSQRPEGVISYFKVGNGIVIDALRTAIAENKINYHYVTFIFEDKKIKVDKYGNLKEWPKGFADHSLKFLTRLLEVAHKKAKLHGERK